MTTAAKPETTSVARRDAEAPVALEKPTNKERKAFLEAVQRTDLDKMTPDKQREYLLSYARHTGLRAEFGECMIFQGRFYITMAGRIRNAHSSGLFDGEESRPVSEFEKKNAGYEAEDIVWKSKVFRKGSARAYEGWGKVTREEITKARAGEKSRYTPIAKHPVEMARKRALYDAMRNAFPIDEEITERTARFIVEAEVEVADQRRLAGSVQEDAEVEEAIATREVAEQTGVGEQPQDGDGADDAQLTQEAALRQVEGMTVDQRRKTILQTALQLRLDESDLNAILKRETGKAKVDEITADPAAVAKVLVALAQAAADRER